MGNVVFHATTIVAVKRGDDVCIGGDGQVTMGESTIMKASAKKVRKIFKNTVVTGFAGSVADAFSDGDVREKAGRAFRQSQARGRIFSAALAFGQGNEKSRSSDDRRQ